MLNFEVYLAANGANRVGASNVSRSTLGGTVANLQQGGCPC
jgi:hypothetical protein